MGLFLAVSFLFSYASIWLVFSLLAFSLLLFFQKRFVELKHLCFGMYISAILVLPQLVVIVSFLKNHVTDGQIAGSAPIVDLNWILDQMHIVIGGDGLWLAAPLTMVGCLFVLNSRHIFNKFLVVALLSILGLSVFISFSFFSVFVARQLVFFSLVLIFIFSQFHDNWRQSFLLIALLLFLGFNSLNGYRFQYVRNMGVLIEQRVPANSVLLMFGDAALTRYYLQIHDKSSLAYQVNLDESRNKGLKNMLLSLPQKNILFMEDGICLGSDSQECVMAKKSLQRVICQKHYCQDFLFEL
jgi:hypothetical protein